MNLLAKMDQLKLLSMWIFLKDLFFSIVFITNEIHM